MNYVTLGKTGLKAAVVSFGDHAVIVHTGHTCVSQAFFDLGVQFCHRRELGDGHQHGLFPIAGSKGPRLGDAAGAEDDLGGGKIIKVLHFIHSF